MIYYDIVTYIGGENIQSVCRLWWLSYDDFSTCQLLHIFTKNSFHYFEDYLMTKLTFRVRYSPKLETRSDQNNWEENVAKLSSAAPVPCQFVNLIMDTPE
jgi:hypothetical protein